MLSVRLRIPAPYNLRNTSLSDCWQGGKSTIAVTDVLNWYLSEIVTWQIGMKKKWRQSVLFFASLFNSTGRLWAAWSWVRGPLLQEHWISICEHWNFKKRVRSVEWMFMVHVAYGIQPRVLKELDVMVGPLSIILAIWGGPCSLETGQRYSMLQEGHEGVCRELQSCLRTWKNYWEDHTGCCWKTVKEQCNHQT